MASMEHQFERLPVVAVDPSGHLISLPPIVDADATTMATRKTRTVVRRGGALVRTSPAGAPLAAGDKLPTLPAANSSSSQPTPQHQQQLQAWTIAADRQPAAGATSTSSEPADLDRTVVSHWRVGHVNGAADAAAVGGGRHRLQQRTGASEAALTGSVKQMEHVRYDLPARPPKHRVTTSAVAVTTSGFVVNTKQADVSGNYDSKTTTTTPNQAFNGLPADETPTVFNRQPIPFNTDQFKFSSFMKKLPVDRRNWSNYSPLVNRCRVVVVHADRRSLQLDESRQLNTDVKRRYCNGETVTRSLVNDSKPGYFHYSRRLRLPTVTSRVADIISVPLSGLYTTVDESSPQLVAADDKQNTEVSTEAMDQDPSPSVEPAEVSTVRES